jgi:hypothetical protein
MERLSSHFFAILSKHAVEMSALRQNGQRKPERLIDHRLAGTCLLQIYKLAQTFTSNELD